MVCHNSNNISIFHVLIVLQWYFYGKERLSESNLTFYLTMFLLLDQEDLWTVMGWGRKEAVESSNLLEAFQVYMYDINNAKFLKFKMLVLCLKFKTKWSVYGLLLNGEKKFLPVSSGKINCWYYSDWVQEPRRFYSMRSKERGTKQIST